MNEEFKAKPLVLGIIILGLAIVLPAVYMVATLR